MSNETFNYTYSASQQEEIKSILKKYATSEEQEDKMELLCRLDKSVTKPGTIISFIVGIVSVLVMGTGMTMCFEWDNGLFIPGVIVGIVGMIGIIIVHPLYTAVTKKQREKIAPEIIRLSDELMNFK